MESFRQDVSLKEKIENGIWKPRIFSDHPEVRYGGITNEFKEITGFNSQEPMFKLLTHIDRLDHAISDKMTPGKFLIKALKQINPEAKPHDLIKTQLGHTNNIVVVDKEFLAKSPQEKIDATLKTDGLITNIENIPLYITGADCAPIAIFDHEKKAIGLFHSGWRGAALEIVLKGIEKMKQEFSSNPEELKVSIGPAISKTDYEVDNKVYDEFAKTFSPEELEKVFEKKEDGKFLLNLSEAIRIQTERAGVKKENIDISSFSTTEDNSLFPSARKAGGVQNIDSTAYIMCLAKSNK